MEQPRWWHLRPRPAAAGPFRFGSRGCRGYPRPVRALLAAVVTAALAAGLALAGCTGPGQARQHLAGSNTLHLAGSDTLLHLAAAWAEAFHARHPGVTLTVVGGGSGVGIKGLLLGVDDIALASRPAGAEEGREARRRGFALVATPVARDAVVVVVHPSNPVRALTIPQLRAIFSGRVGNWRELGGPDRPLVAFSRGFSSGTGQIFRELVYGREADPGPGVAQVPGSSLLHDEVARQPGAVGYLGYAYLTPRVRPVAVALGPGAAPVAPTPTNLAAGRYPLSRHLYFYTRGRPRGVAAAFIQFVLSPEGRRLALEHGYLPP